MSKTPTKAVLGTKFAADGKIAILFSDLLSITLAAYNYPRHTMVSHKLPNHLRMYRKRLGLSQHEVAFLLGWRGGSQASRYEHFYRVPVLRTAFALAVMLRASVCDLFSGEYQQAENAVVRQAQRLKTRLTCERPDQRTGQKLALLNTIISSRGKTS